MVGILARLIVLFIFVGVIVTAWNQTGGKDNSLVERLLVILVAILAVLAFFSPESLVGAAVFSILSFALKPLGLSLLLLIYSMSLITNGGIKNPAPTLIFFAVLILLVSSIPIVAFGLAEQTEKEAVQAIKLENCCRETAPAIVLLGWGTTQPKIPNRISIQLTDQGDRIPFTATLYRRQLAPYVIISAGVRPELEGHIIEAHDIKHLLVNYMGVDADDIMLDTAGIDVRSSAQAVKKILQQNGLPLRVILVTSALEIRRASLTFQGVGIKVIPKATDFYTFESKGTLKRRIRGSDFFPNAEALLVTTKVIDEYLASFYYLLRGWLAPSI